jgi:hypothetical protein
MSPAPEDPRRPQITEANAEDRKKHRPFEVYLVVFQCQGCENSSAFHEYRIRILNHAEPTVQAQIKRWFVPSYPNPIPRKLPGHGVPSAVRSFYEEGGIAEAANAPRAAAAMFRGAVEAICDALEIPRKRSLRDRVDDLATKGIDSDIVADMHEARLVGNDSMHDGLTYSAEELADVADLIADAVKLAFVQPAERQAMRKKRLQTRQAHRAGN